MRSTLIQEEWRPVSEYIGLYEVSNFGRVRSLDHWRDSGTGSYVQKGRILKLNKSKGYLRVQLCKDGKPKWFKIHRLVYEAFNGKIPENMQVNHINEIKTDNSVWNLNLMSPKENINYGIGIKRRATKESQPVLQLTLDEVLVKEWPSMREAGRNGFDQGAVSACCLGKLKSYKGFLWRKKC